MTDPEITDPRAPYRVSAGPYTLDIPANGVAILFEDGRRLPGGVGYLEALVWFAGAVTSLRERCAASDVDILIETGRNEALEEAALVVEDYFNPETCGPCAAAIRALKGQP